MREKDVELAFADYLNHHGYQVVAHQVKLPLGILDVLAMHMLAVNEKSVDVIPVVAEIKLGPINEKACTQLLGYMEQIDRLLAYNTKIDPLGIAESYPTEPCRGFLVGTSLNPMCARVVAMTKMAFFRYDVIGGEFVFEEQFGDGHGPVESYKLTGPLATLLGLAERAKAHRHVARARNLTSYENYKTLLTGAAGPETYESLETTLPYWRRR